MERSKCPPEEISHGDTSRVPHFRVFRSYTAPLQNSGTTALRVSPSLDVGEEGRTPVALPFLILNRHISPFSNQFTIELF